MIGKILDKPEHYRKKVAFIATLVVGVIIFSAWLVIANANVRQAFNPINDQDTRLAQNFENSLPSLRQSEQVTTELAKDQETAAQPQQNEEDMAKKEKKPYWKFW